MKEDYSTPTEVSEESDNKLRTTPTMEELDIKSSNIFGEILGDPWQKKLEEIINYTPLPQKFGEFTLLNRKAQENCSLKPEDKALIEKLYLAFRDAMCIDGPPQVLIELIRTKPNLAKTALTPLRIKRAFQAIDNAVGKLKFDHFVSSTYLPLFATSMLTNFGYKKLNLAMKCNKLFGSKLGFANHLIALLHKYTVKCLSSSDISTYFFLLCFVKYLSYNSLPKKSMLESYPELKEQAQNFFGLFDAMLEEKIIDAPESLSALTS